MLKETIQKRMKAAMKAHHTVEKEILRVALGEISTIEARGGDLLADPDIEKILRKLLKSNRETLKLTDDAASCKVLEGENAVLESLLPQTLDIDQISALLADVADAVRAAASDGQAMGVAMKQLKSKGAVVDGKTVAALCKKLRAG